MSTRKQLPLRLRLKALADGRLPRIAFEASLSEAEWVVWDELLTCLLSD